MKNKFFKLTILILVVTGCSSSEKREAAPAKSPLTSRIQAPVPVEGADEATATSEVKEVESTPTESQVLKETVAGGNDEAISRAAIQVLSRNPRDLAALNALGLVYYHKGQLGAAQLMFDKALRVNANAAGVYNNLGLTYLAEKDLSLAIQSFRRAIELDPNQGDAAANLGAIYLNQKDYTKALVALEMAIGKLGSDQRVLNNYAIALTAGGKASQAQENYKKALQLNSNNKDVMLNYAALMINQLKKYSDGLDLLNKLKFLGPSPEARNQMNVLENKAKAGLK
ncbi:MAG: adventurous gliding motility protein T [Bdellovibrio sp. CG10_big_fil_rev_8_21_14_0_10_47_8]|nr:MAG: adventurous gliding motility protein T [Bdellovibrio sp. CG10_big_fil_rev_8_21_14_0_10_47_8]